MDIKRMHEQIVKWLREEGIYVAEQENPEVHYLINGNIVGRKFDIYQLKERHDQVVISAKVLFSPEHKQAFDQITNKEEFIRSVNKPYLLLQTGFSWGPKYPENIQGIMFTRELFYDGISKNSLFEAIREVDRCQFYFINRVNEELNQPNASQTSTSGRPYDRMYS